MNENWKNDKNPNFGPNFGLFGPNSGYQFFFSIIWLCQSLDTMVRHLLCAISEKTNDQILRKFSNEQTDEQTDRQTRLIS